MPVRMLSRKDALNAAAAAVQLQLLTLERPVGRLHVVILGLLEEAPRRVPGHLRLRHSFLRLLGQWTAVAVAQMRTLAHWAHVDLLQVAAVNL